MELERSISELKGVGEKTEKHLNKLGIYTVEQLVEHFPRSYDVYEPPVKISELVVGKKAAILIRVTKKPSVISARRFQIVTMDVYDGTGAITLKWYNVPYLRNTLQPGELYVFRGVVSEKNHVRTMEQPEVLLYDEYKKKLDFMQPVYPLTEGVTNHLLMKLMKMVLPEAYACPDYIDDAMRRRYRLTTYREAIEQIHFPESKSQLAQARRRLAFDEFFLFSLAVQSMKEMNDATPNYYVITDYSVSEDYIKGLPYPLTGAQLRTWQEIMTDMQGAEVMNRLIQGDVGSGKTVIALLALLAVAKAGFQGCLMAPTEVLARQHYEGFVRDLTPLGIRVELLTGSMTAKEKRLAYERIENHEADIIVGTHALIQEKVSYSQLALVITDEQHRFGVHQREFLAGKGEQPHVLVMSATPIPRTLAMILYGDLNISVIDELPAKRLPIKNCAVGTNYRPKAYTFIEKQVRLGHQAYVICPMVEESENMDGEDVISYTDILKAYLPSDICIEYLHGKQKPKEKNEIMERFARNEIQVLVSTTVVEVGVNVPNATVMMIEDAQRFGLAQLHQLRGRVGRGDAQSYCIFINTSGQQQAGDRLDVLVKSNDGFFIASEDLKMRGPGDLFGIRQSGLMDFKVGDLFNDMDLLKAAGEAAERLFEEDAQLEHHPELKSKLDSYMKHSLDSLIL